MPICAPPCLSSVFPVLHLKHFQCSSEWWWSLSSFQGRSSSTSSCYTGDQRCNVLHFVSTVSVSSASKLHLFQNTWHLWWLFCLAVISLDYSMFRTVYASLGFPYHFSLFVASLLNMWRWWHVWSDHHLQGNPVESKSNHFQLHCQGGGWDLILLTSYRHTAHRHQPMLAPTSWWKPRCQLVNTNLGLSEVRELECTVLSGWSKDTQVSTVWHSTDLTLSR